MKYFCGIPARGGSERLPRKNVVPVAGKPMIAHTIEAALATGRFEAVYVCTDSDEIADVARASGALVPALLPEDLAGPLVASHRACQWVSDRVAPEADALVCLQPTSPLRSPEDIHAGLDRFERGDVDFVVSVTPIDPHYFHWACVPAGDGDRWRLYFGESFLIERPLLPPAYRPNGSIKIARFDALRAKGHFFGERLGVVETPEERSVHVATAIDLELCNALWARRKAP